MAKATVEQLCRELIQIAIDDDLVVPRGKQPAQQPPANLVGMVNRINAWVAGDDDRVEPAEPAGDQDGGD